MKHSTHSVLLAGSLCCAGLLAALLVSCTEPAHAPNDAAVENRGNAYIESTKALTAHLSGGASAMRRLNTLVDDIEPRVVGQHGLDDALMWTAGELEAAGLQDVRIEPVTATGWQSGPASLRLTAPREARFALLPMLGAPGTATESEPHGAVEAEVVLVRSEAELTGLGDGVAGRVVLYAPTLQRLEAAPEEPPQSARATLGSAPHLAAKQHAAALLFALPRPGAPTLMATLPVDFTGTLGVPSASIRWEDATQMMRWLERGQQVRVRLEVAAAAPRETAAGNVVAELRGKAAPDEVVLIVAPLDTLPGTPGVQTSARASAVAMEAIAALHTLAAAPRRTVRLVLLSGSAWRDEGLTQYLETHRDELHEHVAAVFVGPGTRGDAIVVSEGARAMFYGQLEAMVAQLPSLASVKLVRVAHAPCGMALSAAGIPTAVLADAAGLSDDLRDTAADTPDKVAPQDVARAAAITATLAWVLADIPSLGL